jgi:hypothetical protein
LFFVLQSVLSVPGDFTLARPDASTYICDMTSRRIILPVLIVFGLLTAFIALPVTPTPTPFPERDLHPVTDDYGVIEVNLPAAWTDIRTERWLDAKGKPIGVTLLAAYNIEDFQAQKREGVAISVSNRLGKGYIQLLDEEAKIYKGLCEDVFKQYWDLDHPVYRGKDFVLQCGEYPKDRWLDVMTMVNKKDPAAYVVRVIGLDEPPLFGDDFREIITAFKVNVGNLPE